MIILIFLAAALQSPVLKSRLYATQFLIVLLRTKAVDFVEWGMPLLIKQINDKETSISQVALEILTEACHDQVYFAFRKYYLNNFVNKYFANSCI